MSICDDCLLPDYSNCGTNLAASILRYYGIAPDHKTLPLLDQALTRGYRNVVLLLLDGLSVAALSDTLPESGFLRRHLVSTLSAVFPSTTTAATTAIRTGLNPGEHGWLGWTLYFQQLDKSVDIYSNTIQFARDPAADFHAAAEFLPVAEITDRIQKKGGVSASTVSPFDGVPAKTMPDIITRIIDTCHLPGRHYLYAYFGEPDAMMHRTGVKSQKSIDMIRLLEKQAEQLFNMLLPDSLLIVTADHGLIDAKPLCFCDYPKLDAMLVRPPVVEPRAAALYVKQAYLRQFEAAFRDAFSDAFWLMESKEAINLSLFGTGKMNAQLPQLLGDYFAVATGEYALFMKPEHCHLLGMHGGLTKREMQVPLILIDKE